jgi:hypothetical protein
MRERHEARLVEIERWLTESRLALDEALGAAGMDAADLRRIASERDGLSRDERLAIEEFEEAMGTGNPRMEGGGR